MNELGLPEDTVIPPAKPRDADGLDEAVKDAFGITGRIETPLPAPKVEEDQDQSEEPQDQGQEKSPESQPAQDAADSPGEDA